MILVDTSVWVSHFKSPLSDLAEALANDTVYCHPFVIAEIACGTPPEPRQQTINDLKLLHSTNTATNEEILMFIERNQLFGRGCGFVDLAILASTVLDKNLSLWTFDKRLHKIALELNVAYQA